MPKKKDKTSGKEEFSRPSMQVVAMMRSVMEFTRTERFQFLMPESVLWALIHNQDLAAAFKYKRAAMRPLKQRLDNYLSGLERVPAGKDYEPQESKQFIDMFVLAQQYANTMQPMNILLFHFLGALLQLDGSEATEALLATVDPDKMEDILQRFADMCKEKDQEDMRIPEEEQDYTPVDLAPMDPAIDFFGNAASNNPTDVDEGDNACRRIDTDPAFADAPFVGRTEEIVRSITTLCKHSKCNIVYVGDHGVGKSRMVSGLIQATRRQTEGSRLAGTRFYKLNVAALVTGVSYADEVENHVAAIVEDLEEDPDNGIAVLFADNMGELMPQTPNDTTPDTMRLLCSLTEGTNVRIITTASFEQYKRLAQTNPVIARNFCRIDINEPVLEPDGRLMAETAGVEMLAYHAVECSDKMMRQIITAANTNYGKETAMPGRAIDLIDNLGAYVEVLCGTPGNKNADKSFEQQHREIDSEAFNSFMKTMGLGTIAAQESHTDRLRELEPALMAKVFGQDEAVSGVAQSVLLAKAGLTDDTKPLAAYLFVGPTGVGKTELAKVLAAQLEVKLVRFDMSEYAEQHTVSKLVGSPAGYIGYDDGGLLTDAVRKNPNCVLLFDEIEKAHSSVFNLLLQVLDYAQLTDNKGHKADFSGTIIIMTSNAGARFATGAGLGFGAKSEKSEVMGAELKKTFAPEFLNRLTQIVAFHDMTMPMAEKIIDRKVGELQTMLQKKKNVSFTLTPDARKMLLDNGFSSRYGAREMDRSIGRHLKPVLMNALLFGGVREGDNIVVGLDGSELKVLPKQIEL